MGVLDPDAAAADTLTMLAEASKKCLDASAYERGEIDVLLTAGVYRTGFLTEPAVASLLAGLLKVNEAPRTAHERKTFAFDILNGGLGFLNACYVASALL